MKPWWAQSRAEIKMTLARGESLLLTVGIPLVLLIAVNATTFIRVDAPRRIDFLVPGIIALSALSTAMVSLSISTGFDRYYGVLRRLFTTPLGSRALVVSKVVSVLVVEIIQILVLGSVGIALGWRPHGGAGALAEAAVLIVIASVGFAGVGLLLAGSLRAEINLAASNGLYLVLLLVSGFVVPASSMPHALSTAVSYLPSGALAEGLRAVVGSHSWPWHAAVVCVAWALMAPLLAARAFRYE